MLFNAQSAMMMATKALKLPACCHRTTHATLQHTVTSLYTSHFSHISPVSALMFSLSPLSLSLCVCVSFPGFVAEAFWLLLSSLCSACLHQHFAAIRCSLFPFFFLFLFLLPLLVTVFLFFYFLYF